jgi:predicted pyridoxine 5'-phosphate oxidase superfamily flavin-nucleotide-binding protein
VGILTEDMQRVVRQQRLAYLATVCPDGSPNLSPKATTTVWDDDHLVFADLASPGTLANLRHNPRVEVNVVDIFGRRGYRFKGEATIYADGPLFDEAVRRYRESGLDYQVRHIVLIRVERAAELRSPAYARGQTEPELRRTFRAYYLSLDQVEA